MAPPNYQLPRAAIRGEPVIDREKFRVTMEEVQTVQQLSAALGSILHLLDSSESACTCCGLRVFNNYNERLLWRRVSALAKSADELAKDLRHHIKNGYPNGGRDASRHAL